MNEWWWLRQTDRFAISIARQYKRCTIEITFLSVTHLSCVNKRMNFVESIYTAPEARHLAYNWVWKKTAQKYQQLVFAARCYTWRREVSVCLSVTFVYCVKTARLSGVECEPKLTNVTILNHLEWYLTHNFQGHDIIQRQITRNWYKIELYL